MSAQHDNTRMVDDLDQSEEVRSLLRAGIDDEIAGYDFNAGLSAHVAAIAALPPIAQAPVDVATAATFSGKALLAWIGVPVASATVMAALWLGGSSDAAPADQSKAAPIEVKQAPRPQAASPMPSTVKIETSATPSSNAPTVEATQISERATQRRAVRVQRNAAAVVIDHKSQTIETRAIKATPEATEAHVTSAVAATSATTEQTVEPSAAERAESARRAAEAAEQERIAREEARRVAEERLKREMAQLMQAKQALTANPARALSLAQAGEQEFRNSMFSEERQHVLLLALIKLGRVDEAERRAQPFLSAHPDSPFARRVRNALQDAK